MIKECKILSYNKFLNILVFDYDGKPIQTTAVLNSDCKAVFVEYKNSTYTIVKKEEYDKYIKNSNRRKVIKSDICSEAENSEL